MPHRPSINVIYDAIDDDYRLLLTNVANGTSLSTYSYSLESEFHNLSILDSLVLLDSRCIVLQLPAVKPIIPLLHASHSGVNKTLSLTCGLYDWPGMINNIQQVVSTCSECSRLLQSQPSNPLLLHLPHIWVFPCNT